MTKPFPDQPPVCDYEGSDYQQRFWQEADRAYEDGAEAVALRRLLPEQGDLLLEVGAGAGRNTPRYESFKRIVVMDYSTTQLQQAQAFLGRDKRYIYVAADVYHLPFVDGLFDGATMIRVLHHMADAPRALAQVRASLQPDGIFILEYANKLNLKAILRYWSGRQKWSPFSLEPIEFAELNFDFHPKAIRDWLSKVGFSIQRQLTVSHYRIAFLKRMIPTGLLVWMDSLAGLTGDWWQLSPSVFVSSQAKGKTPLAKPGAFFKCPQCGTALQEEHPIDHIRCLSCKTRYPIVDGIYNFKLT
jgi:ubiquinone/menaquinone biosynthesis C-methylase UbiE